MKIARLIRKRNPLVYSSLLIAAAFCSTQVLAQVKVIMSGGFAAAFSAAVVTGSKEVEASKRLISFLASEKASVAIKQTGMESPQRTTNVMRRPFGAG